MKNVNAAFGVIKLVRHSIIFILKIAMHITAAAMLSKII